MKQNSLIKSSSIICLILSIVLLIGWPSKEYHKKSTDYCNVQALVLNYCFVSTHAHFCFVMWNNLATATGWKIFGIKPAGLIVLMHFISVTVPFVPTIAILAYMLNNQVITKFFFFCVVGPNFAWVGYRIWFILFSVPGIVAACILFWKTIHSREQMIKFSNTSQFSKTQLLRMFFAIITYMISSILSIILGLISSQTDPDDSVIKVSDFMPSFIGLLLFLTYGLGTTALEYYKKTCDKIKVFFNFGIKNSRSNSNSSQSNSMSNISSSVRRSSINSSDSRPRRSSQLAENADEIFVYNLASSTDSFISDTETNQFIKRNRIRRGSEPNSRIKSIEVIPEEDEDEIFEKEVENQF